MQGGGGERADAHRRQQRCMAENIPQRCLDFYLRAVSSKRIDKIVAQDAFLFKECITPFYRLLLLRLV